MGDAMKVDKKIFDSWSELDRQDLLIDVAAVVAATEPDRARNGNDAERAKVPSLETIRPGGRRGQQRE
jgi:hypothetical protein